MVDKADNTLGCYNIFDLRKPWRLRAVAASPLGCAGWRLWRMHCPGAARLGIWCRAPELWRR